MDNRGARPENGAVLNPERKLPTSHEETWSTLNAGPSVTEADLKRLRAV